MPMWSMVAASGLSWYCCKIYLVGMVMGKVLSGHALEYGLDNISIVSSTYWEIMSFLMEALSFDAYVTYCILIATAIWSIHFCSWRPWILCHIIVLGIIDERTLMCRCKIHVPLLFYHADVFLMERPMVYSMFCEISHVWANGSPSHVLFCMSLM